MIAYILFKMLVWMYSLNPVDIAVFTNLFVIFSILEFIAVIFAIVKNFPQIITFIRWVSKK